jgi:protein-tyrosine-phosphatase
MAYHILFVCVSNRVRSPFSEFYFKRRLNETDPELANTLKISSAGFVHRKLKDHLAKANIASPNPFYNRPMSQITRDALLSRGIPVPKEWRSRELTPYDVKDADIVIVASPGQKEELLDLFPKAQEKICTTREISKWDKYLVQEDLSIVPLDDRFWVFCEETPENVHQVILEMQEMLEKGLPHILNKMRATSY